MRWLFALALLVGCTTYTPPNGEPVGDGPGDLPTESSPSCTPDFHLIPNGQPGHEYLVISAADWVSQQSRCITQGGYLAIPDDGAERTQIFKETGGGWVGIDDRQIEGAFIDSKLRDFTALVVTQNTVDSDCVAVIDDLTLEAGPCEIPVAAMCECEP